MILRAGANIRDAYYNMYQKRTSDDRREGYKAAKKCLEKAFNQVIEEDLSNKIQEVEAHAYIKHGLSWRLINDITGRKASAKGQLKGDTQRKESKTGTTTSRIFLEVQLISVMKTKK